MADPKNQNPREQRMPGIAEIDPHPVLLIDRAGVVRAANAAARALAAQAVGRAWSDVHGNTDGPAWNEIARVPASVSHDIAFGDATIQFRYAGNPDDDAIVAFGTDVTRLRQAAALLQQSEKMATLGTLVAGVAHELNNPAAATRRAAEQLRDAFAQLEDAHQRLDRVTLSPVIHAKLAALEQQARTLAAQQSELDALARSDAEAAIEEWLEEHDIDDGDAHASALVGLGLDPAALATLADGLAPDALDAVITWAASVFPVHSLLHEIHQGSARLSEIVAALKSYSFIGKGLITNVDVHEGLDSTLVILRSKLKHGITVTRDYGADLPFIAAHGSELNQVWTNIIDNAADAMNGHGEITIRTRRDGAWIVVTIEDNGPGISAENLPHVFEPFFTTKAPGKGTGLGLSTSHAIITETHHGTITVESKPGATRFIVKLPIDAATGSK